MLNKFFGKHFQVHAALTLFKLLIIVVPVSDHDGTSDSDTPVAAAADFKSRHVYGPPAAFHSSSFHSDGRACCHGRSSLEFRVLLSWFKFSTDLQGLGLRFRLTVTDQWSRFKSLLS